MGVFELDSQTSQRMYVRSTADLYRTPEKFSSPHFEQIWPTCPNLFSASLFTDETSSGVTLSARDLILSAEVPGQNLTGTAGDRASTSGSTRSLLSAGDSG